MSAIGFYLQVVRALEEIQAPYMIIGAFAGLAYGITRATLRHGIMFNIIDSELGVKADLVPLTREPEYQTAFSRRVRQTIKDESGVEFDAWYALPTDIIVGKLKAWTEGRSAKHPSDILNILLFSIRGFGSQPLDFESITVQAARTGIDTLRLWQELLARARRESGSGNED